MQGRTGPEVNRVGTEGELTAALGTTWSHCVNVRLALEILADGSHVMRVAKSPLSKESSACYSIGPCGVVEGYEPFVLGAPQQQQHSAARTSEIVKDLLQGLTVEDLDRLASAQ